MTLHIALVHIFGAEPEDIHVPSLTHLIPTLTKEMTEDLIRAGGPRWSAVLDRIAEKQADKRTWKDCVDGRMKQEAK